MANEIVIPRLGWSMEEGTFGEWLKQDGQTVELGEPLFVLEGEKSAQDIEAVDRGILRIPAGGPKPGDTVRVGQVIGFVIKPGESLPEPVGAGSDQPAPPAQLRAEFRVSPQDSSHLRTFPGAAASASPLAPASPRARRAARERGVDLALVPGGGITGRIRERDVVAATAGRPSAPGEAPRSGEPAGPL
ncbi:MAG: hypothetical protein EHM42_13320, partial [Planctomycetaceae bacterium]